MSANGRAQRLEATTILGDLKWVQSRNRDHRQACAVCGDFIPANRSARIAFVYTTEHPKPFWVQVHESHGVYSSLPYKNDGWKK